jgi:ubiquinol-cytochrome c reductase cytochrome b subunit
LYSWSTSGSSLACRPRLRSVDPVSALRNLEDWLDERTGWRAWLPAQLNRTVVDSASWSSAIGASVGACFAVLVVTGVVLMTAYAASPQSAWASVHYVEYRLAGGWMVRGMHVWASQALLGLSVLHVAQGAFVGSYRKPREIAWWLSLLVVALAIGEAITGGLLPWDQRGWWARVVEGNILGLAPVVGRFMQQMMLGGSELGAIGLARAYAIHVIVLPIAVGTILWGRGKLVRRHGWTEGPTTRATYRELLARQLGIAAIVMILIAGLAMASHGAPLDAPADPMSDYPARPEWFLLTMFQLRKLFHGPLEFWGTSLLPAAAGLYLALLPVLDPSAHGDARSAGAARDRRLIALAPVIVIFGSAVALGTVAWRKDARDAQFAKQSARAEAHALAAVNLAMNGVPPGGALEMVHRDPEMHGRDLFERHCASCHVLGDLGDPKKATAPTLDGWGTPEWIAAMMHDPDAHQFFGGGPYKGEMPSVDVRPIDSPARQAWKPILKNDAEKRAVALFLAAEGDEPGDTSQAIDQPTRSAAEKIVSERCTSCHLYKGNGDDEGSGSAPELSHYGSVAWARAQVANPSSELTYRKDALDEERKKHMPRFDGDLSEADVDVVSRWTRAHGRSSLPAAR